MNIQYVRLDDDICEILNRMAEAKGGKVSELVNELLKRQLEKLRSPGPAGDASSG